MKFTYAIIILLCGAGIGSAISDFRTADLTQMAIDQTERCFAAAGKRNEDLQLWSDIANRCIATLENEVSKCEQKL